MTQFDQKRIQRFALFPIMRIPFCNSVFVVKPEESLLWDDGGACDAPRMREHTFRAFGMRNLAVFMRWIWAQATPVSFHASENSSCIGGTTLP